MRTSIEETHYFLPVKVSSNLVISDGREENDKQLDGMIVHPSHLIIKEGCCQLI